MVKTLTLVILVLLCGSIVLSQTNNVSFQVGFFVNGDSADVRIIEVFISSVDDAITLKEVTLNSFFFEINEWSTEDRNLSVKKNGDHAYQLHTHDDSGLHVVDRYFTFELGRWGDLYVPLDIEGQSVIVYESGPNQGKISTLKFVPIRLPDLQADIVREVPISIPGLFYGVKRIK